MAGSHRKYRAAREPAWSEGDRVLRRLPRLWPRQGRPALAILAVVVTSGAVLPALASSASASPTAVVTAGRLAAGIKLGSGQVLMINGDRLLTRPTRHGVLTTLVPAASSGPVMTLRLGAATYEFPVDALPYLGHGLDPSLFNVAALERRESAGRLPVQLTFSGPRHAVPGVKITSYRGQSATGYLTDVSARTFGAALYRQFRADHATGGYASARLFSGVSIALAGAQTVVPLRPQFPMHTLTVTGTNEFGKPDRGDEVLVINADNPGKFGDPIEVVNVFFHGVAKYSVPAGHYWAITNFVTFLKNGVAQRLVVDPQFAVDRNTKIHLSAREASSKITVRTPRPSANLSTTFTVVRSSPHGVAVSGTSSFFGPVYISPTRIKPTVGSLQSYTSAQATNPFTFSGTPYAYNLAFAGPPGLIPTQHFVVTPASLATERDRFYMYPSTFGGWFTSGGFLQQLLNVGIAVIIVNEIPMPGLQTQYMSAGKSIIWQTGIFANNGAGQQDGFRSFGSGQQFTENWNQYPLHPQPMAQLLTGQIATQLPALPSAYRTGNDLWMSPVPFSDNQVGHTGTYPFNSSFSAEENGIHIAGGGYNGQAMVRVSGSPSVVTFTLRAEQPNPFSVLSPTTTTSWVMHTAPAPHAVVPLSWLCLTASGLITQSCKVEPMLTLSYQVGDLPLDAVSAPGHQQIDVSVGHIQLAAQTAIVHASARVSYDDGQLWQPVTLTRTAAGRYRVSFDAPAGVDVTLRFSASDAAGNSINETIINAYSVGL
jgi:hypothetical protein